MLAKRVRFCGQASKENLVRKSENRHMLSAKRLGRRVGVFPSNRKRRSRAITKPWRPSSILIGPGRRFQRLAFNVGLWIDLAGHGAQTDAG